MAKANKQNSKAAQVSLDSRNPSVSLCHKKTPEVRIRSAHLKKSKKHLVPTKNPYETLADMDYLLDIPEDRPRHKKLPKKKITFILLPDD